MYPCIVILISTYIKTQSVQEGDITKTVVAELLSAPGSNPFTKSSTDGRQTRSESTNVRDNISDEDKPINKTSDYDERVKQRIKEMRRRRRFCCC